MRDILKEVRETVHADAPSPAPAPEGRETERDAFMAGAAWEAALAAPSVPIEEGREGELREAAAPFARLGGGQDPRDEVAGIYRAAYWDCPSDVVVYENSGASITVGDVRRLRAALARRPV